MVSIISSPYLNLWLDYYFLYKLHVIQFRYILPTYKYVSKIELEGDGWQV